MTLRKISYRARIIDELIDEKLKTFGAVCIEGAKWCGKTWTALNHANSAIMIGDPLNAFQNRTLAQIDPNLILAGEQPRLVDEWQEVPSIWDAVRHHVDQSEQKGKFLLTGSSTPQTKGILHSGTGRIDRIKMRPMTLFESGESNGSVSLCCLFDRTFRFAQASNATLETLIQWIVRGGWPGSLTLSVKQSMDVARSYLRSIVEDDLTRLDGVKRDIKKTSALLRSLARNVATMASNQTLRKDILENEHETIDSNTVTNYLDAFHRMYLIEEQPAYERDYRSRTRVAKTPKRHFVDPSLAVAALELTPAMLLGDLRLLGFLFESLVYRDLTVYSEKHASKVFHYRHHDTGLEIDAIVEWNDGSWGAFEVKLGSHQIDDAADRLLAFSKGFQEADPNGAPRVLGVICGLADYAYQREDGVYVLPITSLRD